jgi:hypothetical protein
VHNIGTEEPAIIRLRWRAPAAREQFAAGANEAAGPDERRGGRYAGCIEEESSPAALRQRPDFLMCAGSFRLAATAGGHRLEADRRPFRTELAAPDPQCRSLVHWGRGRLYLWYECYLQGFHGRLLAEADHSVGREIYRRVAVMFRSGEFVAPGVLTPGQEGEGRARAR